MRAGPAHPTDPVQLTTWSFPMRDSTFCKAAVCEVVALSWTLLRSGPNEDL